MKRLIIATILITLIISCSNQSKEIDIGLMGIYSGRYSEVGVATRNGVSLAIEKINQQGGLLGKKITFTPLDNKNEKNQVVANFEQHISEGRKFIIGPNISKLANETRMFAMREDILIISPTMSADIMADIDDNFIRVISRTSQEGHIIAKKALDMGLKRAAVVYDLSNAEYTEPIYEVFRETFEKASGKIVYVNHVSNNIKEDFLDMAENINSTQADTLFLLTTAIDAASIAQQVRKTNTTIHFFGTRWAKTLDIISNGGQAVEGMILTSMYTPEKRSDKYISFEKDYQDKFGVKPSFIAAYAYEAVMLLAEGIKKAGSTNVDKVKNALINMQKFDGLEETFTINKFGDSVRKSSTVQIKNGTFEVIDD
ncbi:MAG: hypothetical protein C0602_11340 [Denitrovibrio sp.]|nr:MAG: hypothetical protein C0602_11340 [Denitrovibrio sp.]